jgi:hypothetical protein
MGEGSNFGSTLRCETLILAEALVSNSDDTRSRSQETNLRRMLPVSLDCSYRVFWRLGLWIRDSMIVTAIGARVRIRIISANHPKQSFGTIEAVRGPSLVANCWAENCSHSMAYVQQRSLRTFRRLKSIFDCRTHSCTTGEP